ncbi:RagB/SusD family nutrient uptake outer membrane protein, partial [Sphingobacterium sp.]|uniref:RagB/SusD family nutrient uptake outer membrane protein n=1 Tax=Sphingobacterium sp. TaxID=341027 RepID=UPI00289C8A55
LAYDTPLPERNRATKLAAFALLSRIYLYRREYDKAEQYADSLLNRYDKLIDYNKVSQTSNTPFTKTNDELIMYGATGVYRNSGQINSTQTVFVDSTLIKMYAPNDLRLSIYFINNGAGKYTVKRGYNGTGLTPFNGFAVDEVLLNKIECLVRRGELNQASLSMERLLLNRYKTGTYTHVAFADQQSALQFVLQERRKELVWRCLRWDDIKRLNKEGHGIVLSRKLGDAVYRLEPNTPRYVFTIPQDEINRSGIIQNIR